jgi:hypothetical protein
MASELASPFNRIGRIVGNLRRQRRGFGAEFAMKTKKLQRLLVTARRFSTRIASHSRLVTCAAGIVTVWGVFYTLTVTSKSDIPQQLARAQSKLKPIGRTADRKAPERAQDSRVVKTPAPERLSTQLYAEYPELDPSSSAFHGMNDWEKVIRLRDFSYRHTPFANSLDAPAYRAGAAMVDKVIEGEASLAEAYHFFEGKKGGVLSGHAAELLQRLYVWAGFEALYLNIGFEPSTARGSQFTHALNLVRIEAEGPDGHSRAILSVQDPTLNISYTDSQGRPIDYFEMLAMLARGQAEKIQFAGQVFAKFRRSDPVTVAFGQEIEQCRPEEFARSWNVGISSRWTATAEGHWVFTSPRTVWAFERLGDEDWKPALFRAGYPPQTIYLHCFPITIRSGPEAPSLLKQARQVLSSNSFATTNPFEVAPRD